MNPIKIGFADRIITPTLNGTFLDGYGHRVSPAEGVRDDIHAKVMALSDGSSTQLLFTLDLIGLNPRLYTLVSTQISDLTGVPVYHLGGADDYCADVSDYALFVYGTRKQHHLVFLYV